MESRMLIDDDATAEFESMMMEEPLPFPCDLGEFVANLHSMSADCDISGNGFQRAPRQSLDYASYQEQIKSEPISDSECYNQEHLTDLSSTHVFRNPVNMMASSISSSDGNVSSSISSEGFLSDSSTLQMTLNSSLSKPIKTCSTILGVAPKKRSKKRYTPPGFTRLYVCDWCDGQASFKSCQGLRFHKTIRCPARLQQLGKQYFKCNQCRKAFVTQKGLRNHEIEMHNGV